MSKRSWLVLHSYSVIKAVVTIPLRLRLHSMWHLHVLRKMKKLLPLLLIISIPLFGQIENELWSNGARGISARLHVKEVADSPFLIVSLELKNTHASIPFHFTPQKLKLIIKDENGNELKPTFPRDFSGPTPSWEDPIPLLADSVYKFRISFPTVSYDSSKDGKFLCLRYDSGLWWLPVGGGYTISASYEDDRVSEENYKFRWHGRLKLPDVHFQLKWSENQSLLVNVANAPRQSSTISREWIKIF